MIILFLGRGSVVGEVGDLGDLGSRRAARVIHKRMWEACESRAHTDGPNRLVEGVDESSNFTATRGAGPRPFQDTRPALPTQTAATLAPRGHNE